MRTLIAFVAAAVAPVLPILFYYLYDQFERFQPNDPYIWIRTRNFLTICVIISMAHVLLLGLPAYALLRRRIKRWWSVLLAGFVLAAIPFAFYSWPLESSAKYKSSLIVNGTPMIVDGIPTVAGWVQYAQGVTLFGGCGVLSALAFWLVWRHRRLTQAHEPDGSISSDRI